MPFLDPQFSSLNSYLAALSSSSTKRKTHPEKEAEAIAGDAVDETGADAEVARAVPDHADGAGGGTLKIELGAGLSDQLELPVQRQLQPYVWGKTVAPCRFLRPFQPQMPSQQPASAPNKVVTEHPRRGGLQDIVA